MKFIDLSIPITNHVVSDPPVMRPQIHYTTHETSWEQIARSQVRYDTTAELLRRSQESLLRSYATLGRLKLLELCLPDHPVRPWPPMDKARGS